METKETKQKAKNFDEYKEKLDFPIRKWKV
jgi:hypothetical protein